MSDYQKYTDEEIYEMLLPKLLKNGAIRDNNGNVVAKIVDIRKAIATAYRSGYARCEKGRSFIIGEKKEEWVVVDKEIEVGDMVRFLNEEIHEKYPYYYPAVGTIGEVILAEENSVMAQWPQGATMGDGCWYVPSKWLEVVKPCK